MKSTWSLSVSTLAHMLLSGKLALYSTLLDRGSFKTNKESPGVGWMTRRSHGLIMSCSHVQQEIRQCSCIPVRRRGAAQQCSVQLWGCPGQRLCLVIIILFCPRSSALCKVSRSVPELFDIEQMCPSNMHLFLKTILVGRHSVRPCMLVDQVDRLHCRPWYYLLLKRMVVLGLGNV